jgi:hypothetical protein
MRGRDLHERMLAIRIETLLAEQTRLDRRRAELKALEQELERRLGELELREADHRQVEARIAAKLDRRSTELERREAELERRAKTLDETIRKKARAHAEDTVLLKDAAVAIVQPVEAPPPELRPEGHGWDLNRLEALVEEGAAAFPGRVDEWRYYLLYLREFANVNGVLPRSFDWLVGEAFREVVALETGEPQPEVAIAV